jgi:uncharacterized protein (TIGR04255 family)
MTVSDYEIYANPPLEVVAFELRIPHSLRLADRAAQTVVWEQLRERLPLTQPPSGLQVAIGSPPVQAQAPLRMLDRGRTCSVLVGAESVVVENTSYRSFEDFCAFLREVLAALPGSDIAGFTRIGLRYVNEIRVADVTVPADWEGLIDDALLTTPTPATNAIVIARFGGEVEYSTADQHSIVMRYGTLVGRVVNLEGPLLTRTNTAGPAFLIDLDSYWEYPPDQELPRFSIDAIVETTTRLREPVHQLFEAAITDQLRETFRKERT